MARYRLTKTAYINDGLRAAGDVVDVADDVVPGPHMEPYAGADGKEDKAARKAKDRAEKSGAQMPAPGDPTYIGELIRHALEDRGTNAAVQVQSGGAAEMTRASVPTQFPQTGAQGVIADGDGSVRGVVAGVAAPVQAPFARPPGVPELDAEQAVEDDAAARDGKGPVAEEAASARKRGG